MINVRFWKQNPRSIAKEIDCQTYQGDHSSSHIRSCQANNGQEKSHYVKCYDDPHKTAIIITG